MNFFERQVEVRKASRRLVWLFALAVLCIVVLANLVVLVLMAFSDARYDAETALSIVIVLSVLTVLVLVTTSLYKMAVLRRGGGGETEGDDGRHGGDGERLGELHEPPLLLSRKG
jgi:hypothetical protein